MKIALVGNNDGPIRFYDFLTSAGSEVVYLGLQKKPDDHELKKRYENASTKLSLCIDERQMMEDLNDLKPDVVINVFCNFIFGESLSYYTVLNYHLSPLPLYRGRHPMHWALINGEKNFGSTIHYMSNKVDAGDILLKDNVSIPHHCSVAQLRELLFSSMEAQLEKLPKILSNKNFEPLPNDSKKATYILRRYPEDSLLSEWNDPELIVCKVWALSSESNLAFFHVKGKTYKVIGAELSSKTFVGVQYPTIYAIDPSHVWIATIGGRSLKLEVPQHDIKPNTKINQ